MVPYLLLPFFALNLLLLTASVRADHFVCSWRPGDEAPGHYGFKWFTTAEISKETDTYARWLTLDDRIEVANWGHYKPSTIEINSPCSNAGWEWLRTGRCRANKWAACWVVTSNGVTERIYCLYFDAHDDCEWPGAFDYEQIPHRIEIWGAGDPYFGQVPYLQRP